MKIEVEKLPEAGASFIRDYASGDLALEDERARLSEPLHAVFHARRKRNECEIEGVMQGKLKAECDRCLGAAQFPVDAKFQVTYTPSDAHADTEAHELHAEDLTRVIYENGVIDLDELAREQVLLELPTRILCREDCKGLCPACGANLNEGACNCPTKDVDSRWSALAALKKK
ncbi:MAG: DUF177 domain-containing protein [Pyrinomonadaceae bacterium]